MNYLAHAYLSFIDPYILIGNMISDHVKGKKMYDFDKRIVDGIRLHRKIDEFTDRHRATKTIRSYFTEAYGLYHAVFSDVVCDYFLANDPVIFGDESSLRKFTRSCYETLDAYQTVLPISFRQIYPHMKQHDWLYNYRFHFGIEKSFAGLENRAKYMHESETAFNIFRKNEEAMRDAFNIFFPELLVFTNGTLEQLLTVD